MFSTENGWPVLKGPKIVLFIGIANRDFSPARPRTKFGRVPPSPGHNDDKVEQRTSHHNACILADNKLLHVHSLPVHLF